MDDVGGTSDVNLVDVFAQSHAAGGDGGAFRKAGFDPVTPAAPTLDSAPIEQGAIAIAIYECVRVSACYLKYRSAHHVDALQLCIRR